MASIAVALQGGVDDLDRLLLGRLLGVANGPSGGHGVLGRLVGFDPSQGPLGMALHFPLVKTYYTVGCVIRPVATFASFFVEIRRSTVSFGSFLDLFIVSVVRLQFIAPSSG